MANRGELANDEILAKIGILKFVYQYVSYAVLVLVKYLQVFFEELIGIEKQVVEVHGAGLEAPERVVFIDVANLWPHIRGIVAHEHGVGKVFRPRDEFVFCR